MRRLYTDAASTISRRVPDVPRVHPAVLWAWYNGPMRGNRRLRGAVPLGVLVAIFAAGSATAKTRTVRHKTITTTMLANCAGQPQSQVCPRITSLPTPFASITVGRPSVKLTYATSKQHCSQVSLIVYVDGKRVGRTGALGPGGRGSVTINVPADGRAHALAYRAEGFVGGCNAGQLISVGGQIVVRHVP